MQKTSSILCDCLDCVRRRRAGPMSSDARKLAVEMRAADPGLSLHDAVNAAARKGQ